MTRWIFLFFFVLGLAACGGAEQSQEPLAMPPKEKTWVKTEEVEQTREAYLAKMDSAPEKIEVDAAYKKTLLTPAAQPQGVVKDQASCEAAIAPMEEKRKLLQKSGGMWHAFERSPEVRPFSNNGIQLDSNFNKIALALRHLCATADGVPLSPLARHITAVMEQRGREGAREYFLNQGRAPKDVDIWFDYAEYSKTMAERKIRYATVEELIRKTQTLLGEYEQLYSQKVDTANKDAFLVKTKTLLAVINDSLENVPEFALAMKEDFAEPHVKFEGQM